jgi:hypothetical protein
VPIYSQVSKRLKKVRKKSQKRWKSLLIFCRCFVFRHRVLIFFVFVLFDGQPMGRGSTSGGVAVVGEGNECFQGCIDAAGLDVTMKEAPDLILRPCLV